MIYLSGKRVQSLTRLFTNTANLPLYELMESWKFLFDDKKVFSSLMFALDM